MESPPVLGQRPGQRDDGADAEAPIADAATVDRAPKPNMRACHATRFPAASQTARGMTDGRAGDRLKGGENDVTGKPASAGMKSSGKIGALAGARAFPPLMLVMFHFSEGHHYRNFWPLDLLAARGYLWVEFFFVPVGLHPHLCLWRAAGQDFSRGRGYCDFLSARLIRLYPLHLFMLLFRAGDGDRLACAGGPRRLSLDLRSAISPDVTVKGFSLNLFLVQAWNTLNSLTWNGVVLVRQRGIRALPAVSALSLAGAMARCGAASRLIAAGAGGLAWR